MTSRETQLARQRALSDKHRLAMTNVDDYSDFLETWQAIVDDEPDDALPDPSCFSDFEAFAATAVQTFLATETAASGTPMGHHDCAAITVTAAGEIRQTNLLAYSDFGLLVGKTLDASGIKFLADRDLPTLFAQAPDRAAAFQILRAENLVTDSFVSLAVSEVQTDGAPDPLYLMLFIVPPDGEAATQLMAQRFGFTSTEADIAKLFLDGLPLRDIATRRGRSYPTIRNQFQSVLDKSGCASQTELFRMAFSFLRLMEQSKPDLSKPNTPFRAMTLPRPAGRVVEVVLCGDDAGRPLLSFPSLFGHGITPDAAAEIQAKGILLISIMRPGFGGTTVPAADDDLFDCVAGDVRAILDLLEIDACPCWARASAARPFYNVLTRLPDRITQGVIVNGMIPRNYIAGKTVVSKWTNALMSASILSVPIARLILGTGNTLLSRSRGGAFLQKMYQGSETDYALLENPQVVASIKTGVQNITAQGTGAGVQEIVGAFQDWAGDLDDLTVPVTIYHGHFDPNVPITAVAEFADDHADRLSLEIANDGGGQLSYTHLPTIIDLCFST